VDGSLLPRADVSWSVSTHLLGLTCHGVAATNTLQCANREHFSRMAACQWRVFRARPEEHDSHMASAFN